MTYIVFYGTLNPTQSFGYSIFKTDTSLPKNNVKQLLQNWIIKGDFNFETTTDLANLTTDKHDCF